MSNQKRFSRNFTLDDKIFQEFCRVCDKNVINRSQLIESFIIKYLQTQEYIEMNARQAAAEQLLDELLIKQEVAKQLLDEMIDMTKEERIDYLILKANVDTALDKLLTRAAEARIAAGVRSDKELKEKYKSNKQD